MKIEELKSEDFDLIWRQIANGYLDWDYRHLLVEVIRNSESQSTKFFGSMLIGFLRRMDDEAAINGVKT